jgi:hypothetical protein
MEEIMAETHVVSGLVEKRAEMAGLIEHHRKEMARLVGDLAHLDATLKLFAPELDLRTLRAKEHRWRNPHFRPGEVPRFILDTLRQVGGALTSRAMAERALSVKGLESTAETLAAMQKSLLIALNTLTARGTLAEGPHEGPARTWGIV